MALVNVVKCEFLHDELVHKFPIDDIRLGSQLVVYPGQVAIFVKGGRIYDVFQSGTYTITTDNIPLLGKIINIPFGGDSPFQAEVWFVNTVSILDSKWGTATPIHIEDSKFKVIVPVRAYGQYGFHVEDPRLFLENLSGNIPSFSTRRIEEYLRGVILSKLTAVITQKLCEENVSVVTVNSYVEILSDFAKNELKAVFANYGMVLEMFSIIAINVDENDSSFINLKDTIDSLARINIMGVDNYRMERSFDVLEQAAENESGGLIGAAVGLGAGVGIGSQINSLLNTQLNVNPSSNPPPICALKYYLAVNDAQQGPYDFNVISLALTNNTINENTLVWRKGLSQWMRIGDLSEFVNAGNECPPPLPL